MTMEHRRECASTTQRQSHGPGSHCDAALGDIAESPVRVPLHPGPNYCPGLRTPAARRSSHASPIAAVTTIDDPTGSPPCACLRTPCARFVAAYEFSTFAKGFGSAVINSKRVG